MKIQIFSWRDRNVKKYIQYLELKQFLKKDLTFESKSQVFLFQKSSINISKHSYFFCK